MNGKTVDRVRDRALESEVNRALWSYSPLREARCPIIVLVRGGVVELTGAVPSEDMKRVAGRLARSVPGVRELHNNLISDTALEHEVSRRLAQDPSIHPLGDDVSVESSLGVIRLRGRVKSEALSEAIKRIASEISGVQMVISGLTVEDDSVVNNHQTAKKAA